MTPHQLDLFRCGSATRKDCWKNKTTFSLFFLCSQIFFVWSKHSHIRSTSFFIIIIIHACLLQPTEEFTQSAFNRCSTRTSRSLTLFLLFLDCRSSLEYYIQHEWANRKILRILYFYLAKRNANSGHESTLSIGCTYPAPLSSVAIFCPSLNLMT